MTVCIAGAAWLVQAAQALPDTIITKQVQADPGAFAKVTSVASGLMTIAILVLTVALVPAAWNFRKSYAKVSDLLDRIYGDINPLMRHASSIVDDVHFVTTSVRGDIQQVTETVAEANRRLLKAVSQAEQRVDQLNALLEVVQEEAESAFVSTAATVRGIRTGLYEALEPGELEYGEYLEGSADERSAGERSADARAQSQPRIRRRPGPGRAT